MSSGYPAITSDVSVPTTTTPLGTPLCTYYLPHSVDPPLCPSTLPQPPGRTPLYLLPPPPVDPTVSLYLLHYHHPE